MRHVEIIEILEALAQGVDPVTGEIFPDDCPYQKTEIVRALYGAILLLERAPALRKKRNVPENAGAKWTEAEVERLLKAIDGGRSVSELAELHRRTRGAIRSRLMRCGRI